MKSLKGLKMQEKKSEQINTVIFDLDGTLIDSFEAIREGFNATLPSYNRDRLSLAETKALVGMPLRDTFCELLGEQHADEATRLFRNRYREVFLEMTSPLPHAVETVKDLHAKGYKLAVATNKLGQFSREIIDHMGIGNCITTVVGDGDGVRKKPHPDMIIKILEEVDSTREEAVFIGDSPVDINTGKAAGVITVAVPTGHHSHGMLEDAGAKTVIKDLSMLKEAIAC
jgi:phosphoglycolate phosphatase